MPAEGVIVKIDRTGRDVLKFDKLDIARRVVVIDFADDQGSHQRVIVGRPDGIGYVAVLGNGDALLGGEMFFAERVQVSSEGHAVRRSAKCKAVLVAAQAAIGRCGCEVKLLSS